MSSLSILSSVVALDGVIELEIDDDQVGVN